MASEVNEEAYQDFRQVVNSSLSTPNQWDWIALIDDSGVEHTRIQISADSRAQWMTDETNQTQQVEVTVTGSDSDINTTVTLAESALYEVSSGGTARHRDSMTSATLAEAGDEVTVRHNIETPQV